MSDKAAKVMQWYQVGYGTDSQLARYRDLGAITQTEYDEIYTVKHPIINESAE